MGRPISSRSPPSAKDLGRGFWSYHLDFPGNALQPGCDYLRWQQHLGAERTPTAYAHVVTDPAHPGKLALQYWFFYVFNDWNNLHEGDWEMIQLVFGATTAEAASTHPVEVGYSQHEGAEGAEWGDPKLELVDGTHPVVHPAAGSHANYYGRRCISASSAQARASAATTPADRPWTCGQRSSQSRVRPPPHSRATRGSRSRDAGVSFIRRSSTGRKART